MSSRSPRLWTLALAFAAAGALGLAACSSSPSTSAGPTTSSSATDNGQSSTSTSSPAASPLHATLPIPAADLSPAGPLGTAPTVVVPKGTPPTSLESADLITGIGSTALPGDSATVQYVLATYSSGKVVQSSWTSKPFTFTLGAGQVIPGWDKGVVGMKVGGRRELIIPPSLGYGGQSPGPGVAANDTLVFVVDLLNLN